MITCLLNREDINDKSNWPSHEQSKYFVYLPIRSAMAALWLRPLITEKPVDFSVIRTQIVV